MTLTPATLCLALAIVCWLIAAFPEPPSRVGWFPLGWAFVALAALLGGLR